MGILERLTKVTFGLGRGRRSGSGDGIVIENGVLVGEDSQEAPSGQKDMPGYPPGEEGATGRKYGEKPGTSRGHEEGEEKTRELPEGQGGLEGGEAEGEERAFITWLSVGGRAERTMKEYTWELRWWRRRAKKRKRQLFELSAGEIEGCLRGVKADCALRKLAALKTWSRWRLREGEGRLFMELEKVIRPKKRRSMPRDLGQARFRELRAMARRLAGKGKREGIWLGLMLCGGLRVSEIRTASPYQNGVKVTGKGQRERYVPIPSWLLSAMRKVKKRPPGGWAVSRQVIHERLKALGIRRLHSLRHTYASELIRRGYKIEQVQKLLGHESIKTTTVYSKVDVPEDVVSRLGL